jgi:hypothetical protein
LGDANSKQWKLYNLLNIVNIFKKRLTFHLKNAKTFRSAHRMTGSEMIVSEINKADFIGSSFSFG